MSCVGARAGRHDGVEHGARRRAAARQRQRAAVLGRLAGRRRGISPKTLYILSCPVLESKLQNEIYLKLYKHWFKLFWFGVMGSKLTSSFMLACCVG